MVSLLVAVSLLSLISSVWPDASHVPSRDYLPPDSSGGHFTSVGRGIIDNGAGSGIVVGSDISVGSTVSVGNGIGGGFVNGAGAGIGFGAGNGFAAGNGVVVGGDIAVGGGFGVAGGDLAALAGGLGDQNHFYSAPEEDEYSYVRVNIVPNLQRSSAAKSIFVKAPSYGAIVPEVVAPTLQEDKTQIYLLSQRPEQLGQINLPAGIGTVRGKPEVQFIKYNNAFDAEAKISGALHGQHSGSHVADSGSESNFVRSLEFQGAKSAPVVTNVVQSSQAYSVDAARHVAYNVDAAHHVAHSADAVRHAVNHANGVGRKYLPAGY